MLSFSLKETFGDTTWNIIVIFVSSSDNLTDLKDSIEASLLQNLCPEYCILVGTWETESIIQDVMSDPEMIEAWTRWLPVGMEKQFSSILLKSDKSLVKTGFTPSGLTVEQLWLTIIRRGAAFLFEQNGGLMRAGSMWHYIKPSGKHTNIFIRAANVLVDGCQIEFLALELYRICPTAISTIYCDTSGIHSLAFALRRLIELSDRNERPLAIRSFRSYNGFIDTKMDDVATSVALISASTSGDLHQLLIEEKKIDPARIFTVYYGGSESSIGSMRILSCLNRDSIENKLTRFENANPNNGRFVKNGSMGLQIKGDSFLAEPARIDSHLIQTDDGPKWLLDFQRLFCGTKALRSLKQNSSGEQVYENWLSLESALEHSSALESRFGEFLTNNLPARASQVVIASSDNIALKEVLEARLRGYYPGASFGYFNGRSLQGCPSNPSIDPIVAIVPVVRSGQQILSLSRALRNHVGSRFIHYIVPVAMVESEAACLELQSNLTYGSGGRKNPVRIMISAFMPSSRVRTVWHSEREFLESQNGDTAFVSALGWRQQILIKPWSDLGPSENLFLPNNVGGRLTLRKGFVFDRRTSASVQTDDELYFTVSAVLHNLRKGKVGGALKEDIARHTVLDSGNFDRYNDGAIQAAILRAALPREVDYSGAKEHSERIISILRFALGARDKPEGEAAAELFLAIASGHMKLHIACNLALKSAIQESGVLTDSGSLRELARYVFSTVSP